jgi:uncharacterized protein YrrD
MKLKTRFKIGAAVYSLDDELVGQIERVVLDPITKEVTHIIVRQNGQTSEAQAIPVGWIGSMRERDVTLYCRAAQLQQQALSNV